MERRMIAIEALEYFRTKELTGGSVPAANEVETAGLPLQRSDIDGEGTEQKVLNEEREKQMEKWMDDIKVFIRKIDVSAL